MDERHKTDAESAAVARIARVVVANSPHHDTPQTRAALADHAADVVPATPKFSRRKCDSKMRGSTSLYSRPLIVTPIVNFDLGWTSERFGYFDRFSIGHDSRRRGFGVS